MHTNLHLLHEHFQSHTQQQDATGTPHITTALTQNFTQAAQSTNARTRMEYKATIKHHTCNETGINKWVAEINK